MGGIVAILGEAGDQGLGSRLSAMLGRSPLRGVPEFLSEGPVAIGVQSLGWDASMVVTERFIVAFHGYEGSSVSGMLGDEGGRAPALSVAERIASGWEKHGEEMFEGLRGEWAVVIWDRRRRELVAARDLAGCRPLFWSAAGGRLVIGSEIRQVVAGLDREPPLRPEVVALLLVDPAAMGRNTVFSGVQRLAPGRVVRWRGGGSGEVCGETAFWSPPPELPAWVPRDVQDRHLERLRMVLSVAVRDAVPPVPMAVGLSGGVDSSVLWAILAEENTSGERPLAVTMTYEGMSCDESDLVLETHALLGTSGRFADAGGESLLAHAGDLATRLDQPFLSILASLKLALRVAVEEARHVYLTGMGPDEFFAWTPEVVSDLLRQGHPWRALRDIWAITDSLRWRYRLLRRSLRDLLPASVRRKGRGRRRPEWLGREIWPAVRDLLDEADAMLEPSGEGYRAFLVRNLRRYQAGSQLEAMEQLGASFGVEIRSPLLTRHVIEAAFSLPASLSSGGWGSKYALRILFASRLPDSVLTAPKLLFGELEGREFHLAMEQLRNDRVILELGIVDRGWLEGLERDEAGGEERSTAIAPGLRNLAVRLAGLSAWLQVSSSRSAGPVV